MGREGFARGQMANWGQTQGQNLSLFSGQVPGYIEVRLPCILNLENLMAHRDIPRPLIMVAYHK